MQGGGAKSRAPGGLELDFEADGGDGPLREVGQGHEAAQGFPQVDGAERLKFPAEFPLVSFPFSFGAFPAGAAE